MKKLIFVPVLAAALVASAERVDVYANSFREGGWKLDVQFMDVMGSPYLIAHGLGFPVPDAVATAEVPSAGKWRVWVRTRKWVEGAGTFKVLVNGTALPHVFGRGDSAWGWEDGGEVELAEGDAEIRLRDEDGFDGRCAGVVLASAGERPAGAINVLDRKPEVGRTFDFVVVGGGLPGCCAAVAAARRGLKVALVQDRPVPGGNASGEVRVWSAGEIRYPLVNELRGKFMNMRYENAFSDSDRIAILEREPNLSMFLLHRAFGVEKDGPRIAAVRTLDVTKNRVVEFRAPYFCDTTGDGWVGFWAGAECRYGREGRDETGEKYAPEKGDRMTLGSSIMWQSAAATYDVPFSAPWAEPYACGLAKVNGDWNWEFGLRQDILATGEDVRDRVLLAIYGAFSNAKKDPVNAHLKLVTCPFILGKRETRRLMGDHVFCEQDVTEKRQFDDAVATGSWSIDLHYTIDEKIPFLTRCEQPHYGRYWIPYRSLYSKDVPNLFMAGRCFSCTHVGLGSPRVMNTLSQLGCAVGEAAAMCVKGGYSPRELYAKGHARELQRNLGGDFPGNPDPARTNWRIVDDESAGVRFEGKWHQHFTANGGQCGDKCSWGNEGEAISATYPLPVEKAGHYALKGIVQHLFVMNEAPVAALTVRSGGKESRFEWNQLEGSGFWRDLGSFDLEPGATLEVRRSPKSVCKAVLADGFAVVPLRDCDRVPAYSYRGFMLDEARHFFGKAKVKEYLDLMAEHRMNVFHWHLTDDQGWRIDLPGLPELAKAGARREASPKRGQDTELDGVPYGPCFYTADDIREIVAYAKERGITVVPEVDLPGHVRTILAARPDLACQPREELKTPRCAWGIDKDVLCLGNEETYRYVERILDAVCELFPSERIHIGGDECPDDRWRNCAKCRAKIGREGIADGSHLQAAFTRHVADYLAKKGRAAIGWDEILAAGTLPKGTVVQSWHGGETVVKALRAGHPVIYSRLEDAYLSLPTGEEGDRNWPYRKWVLDSKMSLTVRQVRALDLRKGVPPELRGGILGGECCAWTEEMASAEELDFKVKARLAAFGDALYYGPK